MSPQMKRMLKTVAIFFGLIFTVYAVKKALFTYFVSHYEPPAVTISAAKAKTKTWQTYLDSVGTLTAVNGTDISSETSGIVSEIHFTSGQFVTQGDVLVLLNTDVEQAALKSNQAELQLAKINFERSQTLYNKHVLSQAEYDSNSAKLQQAQANVEATQARINQKTIRAPFSGKIGLRQINVGQYVPAGANMASLQSLDPLYVQFNVPEQYLSDLYLQQQVDIAINTNADNKTFHGILTAINSRIDQATRNISIQATIPNKNLQLYPGMFALVKVWLHSKNDVVTLPETAISYSLHGDSVFIIKEDGKKKVKGHPALHVYRQYVKVGEQRDNEVSIVEGVKPGDQIVTSGQLKLQNGTHVEIDNKVEL